MTQLVIHRKPFSYDILNMYMGEQDKLDRRDNILLEKFNIAAQIQDNYNNLFWYRTSVFFAIIAALFAGYALVSTEIFKHDSITPELKPLILMLVFFGITAAISSGLQMHKRATFLQEYYRFRASDIETSLGVEPEIFGGCYAVATKSEAPKKETTMESNEGTKNVWEQIYGAEWQEKRKKWEKRFSELNGEEWSKLKKKDPGSLRRRLDLIYLAFIIVWSGLSLLGVLVFLQK